MLKAYLQKRNVGRQCGIGKSMDPENEDAWALPFSSALNFLYTLGKILHLSGSQLPQL